MGFFKAEGLISGWVGKIRNNLYFRITRQSKPFKFLSFKISIMLEKIIISNFRSVKSAEINLSKINVIYGGTATGKSSILYALIILKNFVKNPNQAIDSFFNCGFLNLGGFDSCVFNHDPKKEIKIGFSLKDAEYEVIFKKNQAKIKQVWNKFEMEWRSSQFLIH
jgi:AAA15 family ATPase/GTPase